jgi:hypothetical protein
MEVFFMPATQIAPRESAPATNDATATRATQKRSVPARPAIPATDDEILGLDVSSPSFVIPRSEATRNLSSSADGEIPRPDERTRDDIAPPAADPTNAEPENLRPVLDANPDLRRAWDDAHSYRESFATPDDARAATALLADLDRMDALFFSRRPEDHAELARAVAALDPAAFASLAQAMTGLATETQRHGGNEGVRQGSTEARNFGGSASDGPSSVGARHAVPAANAWRGAAHPATPPASERSAGILPASLVGADGNENRRQDAGATNPSATQPAGPTPAQTEFFHAANAAAVESVLDAIESQVERLLPDGVSKTARNRVVGEIYRELDTTLRSNRQLAQQMRDAFRSGSLDADHQRAVVSLITGRARQALPGVAKRVLNEWTSTVVAANHDRRSRQRAAERRVDIAGSSGAGNDGIRSMTPRNIDYARMSDSDILNL